MRSRIRVTTGFPLSNMSRRASFRVCLRWRLHISLQTVRGEFGRYGRGFLDRFLLVGGEAVDVLSEGRFFGLGGGDERPLTGRSRLGLEPSTVSTNDL